MQKPITITKMTSVVGNFLKINYLPIPVLIKRYSVYYTFQNFTQYLALIT